MRLFQKVVDFVLPTFHWELASRHNLSKPQYESSKIMHHRFDIPIGYRYDCFMRSNCQIVKDGWRGLYPLGRHAGVTMPVNGMDPAYYLSK